MNMTHPDILTIERNGGIGGAEYVYECPVCSHNLDESERAYTNNYGDIIGCEFCVKAGYVNETLGRRVLC